jgi:Helix-turn-helix domain
VRFRNGVDTLSRPAARRHEGHSAYPSTGFSWRGNVERTGPVTLEDSIHSQRLRVLRDAAQMGNVSAACRRHGLSRTLFYRLRRRPEQYGPDGVHPKRQAARRGRPPAVPVQTERRVLALALAWPTCGPQWYSDQLAGEGVAIGAVTIWRLLRRQQLGTRRARLAVLERVSGATTGCSPSGR